MPASDDPSSVVTLVRAEGCHYCDDARAALADLAQQYPLRVVHLDALEPDGAALIARHRPPMFPLVLVDGQFFSSGRLPRRKLTALLQERTKAGV